MKSTNRQSFIASVHEDYIEHIERIADELRGKGCEIKQVLKISGVITGKAAPKINLEDLKVKGIASIEKQRDVRKL